MSATSIGCRLDDWRPASDLTRHQRRERLLTAFRLVWDVTAKVDKTLSHALIVERCVERVSSAC